MFKPYGIIPPVVSPLTEDGSFNEKVYCKLLDHLISNGVHGVFPLGTTGEFYAFNNEEAERIFTVTVKHVAGRVPVYAGANGISTRNVIELVKIAERAKVNAVSVLTTMFISQTQDEVYEFYKKIAESTSLPVIIYNNKPKTNVGIEPQTIARLAQIDNIVGVKDSTGDFTNTEEYLRLTRKTDKFSVLLGRDTLIYAGLCYGASGAIASCANVAPRIASDIYNKYQAGDTVGALEAQYKLAPLRIACNMGTFPQVIKEALEMQGFAVGKYLDPISRLTKEQNAKLRTLLQEMQLV